MSWDLDPMDECGAEQPNPFGCVCIALAAIVIMFLVIIFN